MKSKKMPAIHPGEILLEEFMKPYGLSQYRLAKDIGVHPRRINEIVQGKRAITANTALRLARYFCTTAEFWLGLQSDYDLKVERNKAGDSLDEEITPLAAALRHIIESEATLGALVNTGEVATAPVDRCYYCGNPVAPGQVILEVRQQGRSRIVQSVPGDVCRHCGQGFLTAQTGQKLNRMLTANP